MTADSDLPPESWATSVGTRKSMQSNRRRDTSPEMRVRRLLHARGLRYRVDMPLTFDRRRRADITFTRAKVVVFIDGCFWHGCPEHYVEPKSHSDYWPAKIARNRARDDETAARLEADGWTVLRFWEHEDPEVVVGVVMQVVGEQANHEQTVTPLQQPRTERKDHRAADGSSAT